MLDRKFISNGFCFIGADYYLNKDNLPTIHDLKKVFDMELEEDGSKFRKRAYLKLHWDRVKKEIRVTKNQGYFQSSAFNAMDGGKVREFKVMDPRVLEIGIIKSIISKNIQMVSKYTPLQDQQTLTIGLHFIRYQANENGASYSSPDWLHKDDEPLVFIHLINLSKAALGGDNLIADSTHQRVSHVVRLENDIDTLALNKNVYHAVTPLGSKKGVACRDVILFTIEPQYTQQGIMDKDCA